MHHGLSRDSVPGLCLLLSRSSAVSGRMPAATPQPPPDREKFKLLKRECVCFCRWCIVVVMLTCMRYDARYKALRESFAATVKILEDRIESLKIENERLAEELKRSLPHTE
jgi:hypothetical protein